MNDYLSFMMQTDPSTQPVNKQRQIANQLRGMAGTGAMLSTSQIPEVSAAGQGAVDNSFAMGQNMGRSRDKRLDRESFEERARLTRAAAREREKAYQTQKDKDQYLPSRPERDAVRDSMGAMRVLDRLGSKFDASYAGGASGLASRLRQKGMRYEPALTQSVLSFARNIPGLGALIEQDPKLPNVKADGTPLTPEEYQQELDNFTYDRDQWWRDLQLLYTLPQRNRLFGATLTPSEAASWDSANVGPDSTPEQIQRHLTEMRRSARDASARLVDEFEAMGVSSTYLDSQRAQLEEFNNGRYNEEEGTAPAEPGTPPTPGAPRTPPTVQRPSTVAPPANIPAEEWSGYSDRERQEILDYIEMNGGLPE